MFLFNDILLVTCRLFVSLKDVCIFATLKLILGGIASVIAHVTTDISARGPSVCVFVTLVHPANARTEWDVI